MICTRNCLLFICFLFFGIDIVIGYNHYYANISVKNKVPIPYCPKILCKTANITNVTSSTQEGIKKWLSDGDVVNISNIGTDCSGFIILSNNTILELFSDNISVIGTSHIIYCPQHEGIFSLKSTKSSPIVWHYLSNTNTLDTTINLSTSMNISINTTKSDIALLLKINGQIPRMSIGAAFHSISSTSLFVYYPEGDSWSLNLYRDIDNYLAPRISTESKLIIEVYLISNTEVLWLDMTDVASSINYATVNCSGILSEAEVSYLDNNWLMLTSMINYSNCVMILAGTEISLIEENQLNLTTLDPIWSKYRSWSYLPIKKANTCYEQIGIVLPVKPFVKDYYYCETMIRWPCSYDSDCTSIYGLAYCTPGVWLCNYTVQQVVNCTISFMNNTLTIPTVQSYIDKYQSSNYSYNPPRYYSHYQQCIDGYSVINNNYGRGIKSCAHTKLENRVDGVEMSSSGCYYFNGLIWLPSKYCTNHCNILGYEGLNSTQCENFIDYLDGTCSNNNVIVGVDGICSSSAMKSCSFGSHLYYDINNTDCVRYIISSYNSAIYPVYDAPIGTFIPPRYIYPELSPIVLTFSNNFNWDGFFGEMEGLINDYENQVWTNRVYLPLVYSNDASIIENYKLYFLYKGHKVNLNNSLNITSNSIFSVFVSPSATYYRIDNNNSDNVLICYNMNCTNYNDSVIFFDIGNVDGEFCVNNSWSNAIPFNFNLNITENIIIDLNLINYGLMILKGVTIVIKGDLYVENAFFVLENSTSLSIGSDFFINGSIIEIASGIINIDGCLNITNSSLVLPKNTTLEERVLINHKGCIMGKFDIIYQDNTDCSVLMYKERTISTVFIPCTNLDKNLYFVIGGSVGAVLLVLIVIIVIVSLKVKKIRSFIAPFHYRKRHKPVHSDH